MEPVRTRSAGLRRPCGRCGHANVAWAVACTACGHALGRSAPAVAERPAPAAAPVPAARRTVHLPPRGTTAAPVVRRVLGIGAFLAPALGLLPILRYMGWFLASLVHEIGHCVAAWLCGMPAYPAIRIDGHAAAIHSEQKMLLVVLVWSVLLWLTWQVRRRPRLRVAAGAAVMLYPVLALTEVHEVVHLLAGHAAELTFGGIFFYRALSGGFTSSVPERVAYATCAWFLVGRNVVLDFGLMTDAGARAAYAGNGSFGLTQDFIRAARELGWSLPGVAALMLLLSLAALPLAWWLWRRIEARETLDALSAV